VSATEIRSYQDLYPQTAPGALLADRGEGAMAEAWRVARAETFARVTKPEAMRGLGAHAA